MQGKRILVIDDEPLMRDLVRTIFRREGADVATAENGEQGLNQLVAFDPDLVILDVLMPVLDGWQTLKQIRAISNVAVIMLTVLRGDEAIVHGLNAGADDYIPKPFHPEILVARANAAIRCQELIAKNIYHDDGYLRIDLAGRRVLTAGEPVSLTGTEFALLSFLVQNAGRICTYDEILKGVWPDLIGYSKQNVHLYIWQLRQKLEPDPKKPIYILTEHGIGYSFAD